MTRTRGGKLRAVGALTLAALAGQYLDDLALRAKRSTLKAARSALAIAVHDFGDVPVADVDRLALEAWRRARVAQGRSNRTVNRDLTTLGAAFGFALDRDQVTSNPVRALRRLPQKGRHRRKIGRASSTEEIQALLAAAATVDARHPQWFPRAPVYRALHETGCRWGELVAATWADLDTDRSTLRLRGETTKTDRERIIPISAALLTVLVGLRADHVRVRGELPQQGTRIFLAPKGGNWSADTGNYHTYLREVLRVAGVPKADAAGRVPPSARRSKVVHHALRSRRRSGSSDGKARRNRDAASRG